METAKMTHNFKHLDFMKPQNTIENLMRSMRPQATQRKVKLANN